MVIILELARAHLNTMYMQEGKESPKKCIRQEGGEEERKQGRKDGIREGARDLFLLDKLISNHLSKNVG